MKRGKKDEISVGEVGRGWIRGPQGGRIAPPPNSFAVFVGVRGALNSVSRHEEAGLQAAHGTVLYNGGLSWVPCDWGVFMDVHVGEKPISNDPSPDLTPFPIPTEGNFSTVSIMR